MLIFKRPKRDINNKMAACKYPQSKTFSASAPMSFEKVKRIHIRNYSNDAITYCFEDTDILLPAGKVEILEFCEPITGKINLKIPKGIIIQQISITVIY